MHEMSPILAAWHAKGQRYLKLVSVYHLQRFISMLVNILKHGSNERDRSSSTARSSPVMLSEAKHLAADRNRPFASLRVTWCDGANYQGLVFTIEPCLSISIYIRSSSDRAEAG